MNSRSAALLLHSREEPLRSLKPALEKLSISSVRARSCGEALKILKQANPPHIIFTDLTASDSTWAEALGLPARSPVPVNLIVVSEVPDLSLCKLALECGAFDFMMSPAPEDELRSIVQRAVEDVVSRRGKGARIAKTASASLAGREIIKSVPEIGRDRLSG
jgi:pilus assembly protein CpaE